MSDFNPQSIAPSAASALIGDPAQFGRVAEDGTVYVRTPDGEKAVGSYPGKSAEEALAYFVRKFELVAGEIALLAARIKVAPWFPPMLTSPSRSYAIKYANSMVLRFSSVGIIGRTVRATH